MKKAATLVLDESEVIELIRILLDRDAEGALAFLERRFKCRTRDLLEGG